MKLVALIVVMLTSFLLCLALLLTAVSRPSFTLLHALIISGAAALSSGIGFILRTPRR